MMKILSLILVSVLLMQSCGDKNSKFDMNIKLSYHDTPLIITQDYTYPDGRTIRFNRISFFISDLKVSDGIETVRLVEAQHVNLTQSHIDEVSARLGYQVYSKDIALGSIDNVSFNLGLTPEQNNLSPSDYPIESDLSNSAEYWIGWESYVFAKIEGLIDLDNDGSPESTFALHLGSDSIMRTIDIANIDDGRDSYDLNINLDIRDVFISESDIYDIVATSNIHSLQQIDHANFLINNWERALENGKY